MCAEYLDLYWSRAARCVALAAVFRCMRRLVDTLWLRFSIARAPGLLVYNNIAVDATFKLTKISQLHLTITAHQP